MDKPDAGFASDSTGSMTPPPPLPSPPSPKVKLESQPSVPGPSSNGIKREPSDHLVNTENKPDLKPRIEEEQEEIREELEVIDVEQIAKAKERHQADLTKHHYEPPQAERPQDDWQVAYVWAFIVKFDQISRIRKLECLEDLEQCLVAPVANRPDDILEGILLRFLANLKPGLRSLHCENVQAHLSSYISDALLHDRDFTVWDRPWAPNELPRGSCCNLSPERVELGRLRYVGEPLEDRVKKNPFKQMEAKGAGLFEMTWGEKARLLRQLVDWQLAYSEPIKSIINKQNKAEKRGAKKTAAANAAALAETDEVSIELKPLGMDRNKNRIWSLDHSSRLYKSGNPFKRPSPIATIANTRQEFQALLDQYTEHGALQPGKLKGKDGKKATGAELVAYKKLIKGIEDEKALAQKLEELVPLIEKEEGRIQRARRKIAAAAEMIQQAELRQTRTRRSNRQVNYVYDGGEADEDSDDFRSTKRTRRGDAPFENGLDHRGRPVIPGERRSTRVAAKEVYKETSDSGSDEGEGKDDDGDFEMRSASPEDHDDEDEDPDEDEALPTASTSRSTTGRLPGSATLNGNGRYPARSVSSSGPGPSSVPMSGTGSRSSEGKPKPGRNWKGYALVEEYVPFDQMTEKEQREFLRAQREQEEEEVNGTSGEGHEEARDKQEDEKLERGQDPQPPSNQAPDADHQPTATGPLPSAGNGGNGEDLDRTLVGNGGVEKVSAGVDIEMNA